MLKLPAFSLIAILTSYLAAHAAEFGNPFTTNQSREASAQAIDGLIRIFSALRDRELKGIDGGQAHLIAAADALRLAAAQMEQIGIPDSENVRLGEVGVTPEQAKLFSQPPPVDFRQLYKIFIAKTKDLGEIAGSLAAHTDVEMIMPKLAAPLALYIQLGNTVTGVARSGSCRGAIDVPLITKLLSGANIEVTSAVGPDGMHRVISLTTDGSILISDATGKLLLKHTFATPARHATFSPDGALIIAVLANGSLEALETAFGKPIWEVRDNARSAVFSPDGTHIVAVLADGSLQVLNGATGEVLVSHC